MRFQRIFVSVLGLAAAAAPAWSTPATFYTSQAAFNTATQGVFFQGVSLTASDLNQGGSTGLVDPSGVTITDIYNTNSNLSISGNYLVDNGHGFNAILPSSVTDFWFTITAASSGTLYLSFYDANGYESANYTVGSSPLFLGVTSAAGPITNLNLSFISSSSYTLDAFDVNGSGPGQAPEGATLLLIGSGLIAMRWLKRRNKTRGPEQERRAPVTAASLATPQTASS